MPLCDREKKPLCFGPTNVYVGSSFEGLRQKVGSAPVLLCIDGGVPETFVNQVVKELGPCVCWKTPGGEKGKSRETKAALEDFAMALRIGADTHVVVLGGGATLDLAGFFAATYDRGLALTYLPSTLLAMADSCLGGKNGINVHGIKNVLGTMYHPHLVVANVCLLDSLDDRQILSGFIEVAKHAMLSSQCAFDALCTQWPTRDHGRLKQIVADSLRVKGGVVVSKSVEKRHVLNIGHSIAHVLEGLEKDVDHGICVAVGLFVESMVGFQKGYASRKVVLAAEKLLELVKPYVSLRGNWDIGDFTATLGTDKKNLRGNPHMVFLEELGRPYEGNDGVRVGIDPDDVGLSYKLLDRFRRV